MLVGIAAGIVIGAMVGGVVVAVTAPVTPLGQIAALSAVGIVIGAPLGAYIGFERAGTLSDAWNTTFDELEDGATWIGVRIRDPASRERVLDALDRRQPSEIREL